MGAGAYLHRSRNRGIDTKLIGNVKARGWQGKGTAAYVRDGSTGPITITTTLSYYRTPRTKRVLLARIHIVFWSRRKLFTIGLVINFTCEVVAGFEHTTAGDTLDVTRALKLTVPLTCFIATCL